MKSAWEEAAQLMSPCYHYHHYHNDLCDHCNFHHQHHHHHLLHLVQIGAERPMCASTRAVQRAARARRLELAHLSRMD